MLRLIISILIVLLIVLSFDSAQPAELCHPEDKQALLQIKNELGNPTKLSSWSQTSDCCRNSWAGVACTMISNQGFRVYYLILDNIDIPNPCPIPPSLGNISFLKFLFIQYAPNIIGNLPRTITKLTRLNILRISYTHIFGPIPEYLSEIKTLKSIDFSNNRIVGNLPTWLPSLPYLSQVYFQNNFISGPIPDTYGSLSKSFKTLVLFNNRLTGKIPMTLTKLNLQFFDVSYNILCGEIPQGGSLQKFDATRYAHNKCLCGSPLPRCRKF